MAETLLWYRSVSLLVIGDVLVLKLGSSTLVDMSGAAISLVAWGIYALSAGMALMLLSDFVLPFLGMHVTTEHWILIVALMMMGLGFYYIVLGVTEVKPFFVVSVIGRTLFFIVTSGLIVTGKAPVSMLLFGVIDLATALWTAIALRLDKNKDNPLAV